MKNYTFVFLMLLLISSISSCTEKEIPSDAEMNDTIETPSILKEVDDASTYMSDTNRITTDDSITIQKNTK